MLATFVTLGFALASMSAALPTENAGLYDLLSKRAVSPDNTCGDVNAGANNSYSCDAVLNSGGCCSQFGECPSPRTNLVLLPFTKAYSRIKGFVEIQPIIAV
jgi:hypothetical protein